MISGKKVTIVLPAYNAAKTLKQTYDEIPLDIVDDILLVDDASRDHTLAIAASLGIEAIRHDRNRGYGGNQKTCYAAALARGADIVVMLHPDYQYTPKLVTAMAAMIASEQFDVVLASRILGRGALAGGMPLYKYLANRFLTFFENIMLGQKLSEYHTGYRAWSRRVLETLPLHTCSEGFVFDNQMLAQSVYFGFAIGEISCPTRYLPEASSIGFFLSVIYGLGVVRTAVQFRLQRWGLIRSAIFTDSAGNRVPSPIRGTV
jgi:glycosyltransferase involved in cell wall biosynthesis